MSNLHSVRKSILSLLCGIAADKKLLDLDMPLSQADIEFPVPLDGGELRATVRDLLMARSGVYLPALGETSAMRAARPRRGSHQPGEQWYYNNWDFNALGVIFERYTGITIGRAIREWLADPLGMQDFQPEHVVYRTGTGCHRQYIIGSTSSACPPGTSHESDRWSSTAACGTAAGWYRRII